MKQRFILFLAAGALFMGCLSPRRIPPQQISPDFPALSSVSLLPVTDLRKKKETAFGFADYTGKSIKTQLKRLKYQVIVLQIRPEILHELTMPQLLQPEHSWLDSLPSGENRYVMLPVLTAFDSKMRLGWYTEMQLSAYLYDRQTAKLLWRHTGSGEDAGPLIKELNQINTINTTTIDLIRGFPLKK